MGSAVRWGCPIAVGSIALLVAAAPLLLQSKSKSHSPETMCLTNMRYVGLGLMMYAQDYDERLPPTTGWSAHLGPYVKNESRFRCPSLAGRGYGYAFDARLDRLPLEKLAAPADTVALYETTDWSKNASWPGTKFATRHGLDETHGNVAFADGHAKALKAEAFEKLRPFREKR